MLFISIIIQLSANEPVIRIFHSFSNKIWHDELLWFCLFEVSHIVTNQEEKELKKCYEPFITLNVANTPL